MASLQFSVRIPPELDKRVKEYAAKNNTTKSDVMVTALARYLGYESKVPMNQRMVELEQRMAKLETEVKELKDSL